MLVFLLKRTFASLFIISGSFAFIYCIAATVGDPLAEIRLSNPPNLEYLLLSATRELRLDQSIPERFVGWYSDVLKSLLSGDFTLGYGLNGRPVSEGLITAIAPTFTLVGVSIAISLLIGSASGLFVAARRLGIRESVINLVSFLGYVAPVFWIGHLFKQYVVVAMNDNAERLLNWYGLIASFVGSSVIVFVSMFIYFSYYSWSDRLAKNRYLIILGVAIPAMGLGNTIFPIETTYLKFAIFSSAICSFWILFWKLIGSDLTRKFAFGLRFGLIWLFAVVLQKLISTIPAYMSRDEIIRRPFPSFGYESVWYTPPDFWLLQLDRALHTMLPSLAIAVTTIAIYYQVTKSVAIETLESDYVKMARAKGLSEIELLVRHVYRNCLLSITNTFVANYLYLFNGVIIVELVFGWQGIGVYLMSSLFTYDLNRLMGGIFVIGVATFVAMLLSDLVSRRIDPRIREFG